ncbi:MAG: hypothetical protein V4727_07455 [Verrucomicrobiota bacterium]
MKKLLFLSLCAISIMAISTSCKKKGPAEKAGEKMDEAIEDVQDSVNPKGPVEKVGEKIDDAVGE